MSMLRDEASIAAYAQDSPIEDLQRVRPAFRTIEVETEHRKIGAVPVEGYPASHDIYVFVTIDGWFVTYLSSGSAANIIAWIAYRPSRESINIKLENVPTLVASRAGMPYTSPTFHDCRYPNATHLRATAPPQSN